MKKTRRGFNAYGTLKDINGQELRVQESSLATDTACWIFVSPSEHNPDYTPFKVDDVTGYKRYPSIQVNVKQAKKLIKLLEAFINKNRFTADPKNELLQKMEEYRKQPVKTQPDTMVVPKEWWEAYEKHLSSLKEN